MSTTTAADDDALRSRVRARYAQIATGGGCCGTASAVPAKGAAAVALGYSADELAAAPAGSNLGLGCGNPQAIAALRPGETVLDLGSGAGFDCFLARRQVGASGRVMGVDMTPEMLGSARANAAQEGYANVEFRLGEIEHLPVADGVVDVVISNCVVNLSPDKPQVYREAFRVLRPGGRIAISDVVAVKPIPPAVRADLEAYCGCVAGAAEVAELEQMLTAVGFADVAVRLKPASREFIKTWFPGCGVEEFVLSADIEARKGVATLADAVAGSTPAQGLSSHTEELVGIGAAITAHCQPCLTYHVARARDLGVPETQIAAAVAVGQHVEAGALGAMREFARGALGAAAAGPAASGCPGASGKSGRCCGG